jgi:8-oxo-dGTP pyrophosphatase MutT (NUDIX family)
MPFCLGLASWARSKGTRACWGILDVFFIFGSAAVYLFRDLTPAESAEAIRHAAPADCEGDDDDEPGRTGVTSITEPRQAARVLLLHERAGLLLLRAEQAREPRVFWIAPGGGLDAGETHEQAAVREVREETGIAVALGPAVWVRRHRYTVDGRTFDQAERYYLARTRALSVRPLKQDAYVTSHRWWTPQELLRAEDVLVPRRLGELLPPLLRGELPAEPIDCGI